MLKYLSFILLLVVVSCQTNEDRNDKMTVTHSQTDSSVAPSSDPCVRGTPEPLIKKDKLSYTDFQLSKDARSGLEIATLPNGDTLKIKNWGCEYYVLTYQFITSRFEADTNDLKFWFNKSKIMLTGTLGLIDAPLHVKKGIMHLGYYIYHADKDSDKQLTLGEEIDFGEDVIREFISIDRIAKLNEDRYLVEISLTIGPL